MEMASYTNMLNSLVLDYLFRNKFQNSANTFCVELREAGLQASTTNNDFNTNTLEEIIKIFYNTKTCQNEPYFNEFGQKLKNLTNEYLSMIANYSNNQKILYEKNVHSRNISNNNNNSNLMIQESIQDVNNSESKINQKNRAEFSEELLINASTSKETNNIEKSLLLNDSIETNSQQQQQEVQLSHLAKRKPKEPISIQKRLKHGFLAHETVQRIATIANANSNLNDTSDSQSSIISTCLNENLGRYLDSQNFNDLLEDLDNGDWFEGYSDNDILSNDTMNNLNNIEAGNNNSSGINSSSQLFDVPTIFNDSSDSNSSTTKNSQKNETSKNWNQENFSIKNSTQMEKLAKTYLENLQQTGSKKRKIKNDPKTFYMTASTIDPIFYRK